MKINLRQNGGYHQGKELEMSTMNPGQSTRIQEWCTFNASSEQRSSR